MHVDSIEMGLNSRKGGSRVNATAQVTVVDGSGSPVRKARVYGHWEDATGDSDSDRTDRRGEAELKSDWVNEPPSGTTFTFVVDTITNGRYVYDADANAEDSDSISVP